MANGNQEKQDRRKPYWLDDRRNVDKLVYALYVVCGALFAADFLYHKHVHFGFENWLGFYGIYGFVSCVGLVFLAIGFRKIVKRRKDYYDA